MDSPGGGFTISDLLHLSPFGRLSPLGFLALSRAKRAIMRAALRYIAFESTISPTIAACYRKYSDKYSKVDIVHDLTLVLDTL